MMCVITRQQIDVYKYYLKSLLFFVTASETFRISYNLYNGLSFIIRICFL